MEKEKIETDTPVTIAGVTLVPIVKTRLDYWQGKSGFSSFGIKQPVGIIVISPQARKAFRISGEEITLDQLIEEVPDVEKVLGAF